LFNSAKLEIYKHRHKIINENIIKIDILVGGPEGRRPLGRPRRRWEDNIKMDLREIGFGDVDWIHWAQDREGGGLL
jgi:hypothetical protein